MPTIFWHHGKLNEKRPISEYLARHQRQEVSSTLEIVVALASGMVSGLRVRYWSAVFLLRFSSGSGSDVSVAVSSQQYSPIVSRLLLDVQARSRHSRRSLLRVLLDIVCLLLRILRYKSAVVHVTRKFSVSSAVRRILTVGVQCYLRNKVLGLLGRYGKK